MKDAHLRFDDAVAQMVTLLHDLGDTLENSAAPGELNFCADLATQVGGIAESFVAFANEVDFVLKGADDAHVCWAERMRLEKRRRYVRLVAAPLSVADALRKMLYDLKDSVILSSATLRVGNDFKYMCRRLGFCDAANVPFRCLTATSPFDYFRQCLVLAPDCLPDPSSDSAGYSAALAALLKDLFSATNGRALVLFTSYEMMKAVADNAAISLAEAGIRLLVQGEGLSRESMTQALKEDSNIVARPFHELRDDEVGCRLCGGSARGGRHPPARAGRGAFARIDDAGAQGGFQYSPLRRTVVLGGRRCRGRGAFLRRHRASSVRAGGRPDSATILSRRR